MKLSRWTLVCTATALGCKASVSADVKASASAHGDFDQQTEEDAVEEPADETSAAAPDKDQATLQPALALLGARHDVVLAKPGPPSCRCLSVSLGQPADPAFKWESKPPLINPSTQLVFAMASDKAACAEADKSGLGASYRGYVRDGNNVVILIENGYYKRPITLGAIIPRPEADGQVIVQAAFKHVPYGRPLQGEGARCAVPTPAAPAPAPIAQTAAEEREPPAAQLEGTGEVKTFEDVSFVSDEAHQEEPSAPRSGFYLSFAAGAAYLRMPPADGDVTFSGIGIPVDLYVGGSLSTGLALGGVVGGAIVPEPKAELDGGADVDLGDVTLSKFRIGPFIDYYPSEEGNFHLQAELGVISFFFTPGSSNIRGASAGAGLGYDGWISERWSMGLLGRFTYAYVAEKNSSLTFHTLLPALLLSVTYH